MAFQPKVLGQSAPAATTLTALYTVPAVTKATGTTLWVCNRGATATTFRVSIAVAGAADTNAQYIIYDQSINGNDTFAATTGFCLATTDVVRVYAGNANLSFNLHGIEET